MTLNNHHIAILTKVNELAERFGVKPYDFAAEVRYNPETTNIELEFVTVSQSAGRNYYAMVDALTGNNADFDGTLAGSEKELIDALDQAMTKAPRARFK